MTTNNVPSTVASNVSKLTLAQVLANFPRIVGTKEFDYAAFTDEQMDALKSKNATLHATAVEARNHARGIRAPSANKPASKDLAAVLKVLGMDALTFGKLPKDTQAQLLASTPVPVRAEKAVVEPADVASANGMTLAAFSALPAVVQANLTKAFKQPAGFTGKAGVRLGVSKETGLATGTVQITTVLFKQTIGLTPNNLCRLAEAMVEAAALTEANFDTLKVDETKDRAALKARVARINAALQSIKADLQG